MQDYEEPLLALQPPSIARKPWHLLQIVIFVLVKKGHKRVSVGEPRG